MAMKYCVQCKKSLEISKFDKKNDNDYYSRCIICREIHNKQERNKYEKRKCTVRKLCGFKNCEKCFNKSFASFDELTTNGKKKVDCWDYEKNWDYKKNKSIKPWEVFKSKGKVKFWFKCDNCHHSFDSVLYNISKKNKKKRTWCPYCSNQKMCENNEDKHCITCYNKSFASFDELTTNGKKKVDCWDYNKNKDKPWEVFKYCNEKFWFKCDNCPHSFESGLSSISSQNRWCPYCPNQKLCENNEDKHCITCYNKSFASLQDLTPTKNNTIKKVDCWDYNKNKKKPWEVFKSSATNFWFKCDNCPHSFNSKLDNISSKKTWCPYCRISSNKFCDEYKKNYKNCQHCFNKSFASFDGLTINDKKKVDCWDYKKNKSIKPWEVFKLTSTKFWFKCDICPHSFYSGLSIISNKRWCPYCCNNSVKFCDEYKKDYKNCQHCFNKSFASFDGLTTNGKKKIDCWDYSKNEKKPWEVFKSTATKFWFKCDNCPHSFNSALNHISNNRWCPHCKNKTEKKLYEFLQKLYPNYIIKKEYKKKWCRNPDPNYKKKKEPCYYPYDFNIQIKEQNINIIIELDGRQHFEYVSLFNNNVEDRQNIDFYKMFQAYKNNHSFIRIFQEDVFLDNNDWKNKLKKCIDKIIKSNNIMSLYVDNGNLYDNYKKNDPYKILKFKEVINQIKKLIIE
jgi:hypothetical protein